MSFSDAQSTLNAAANELPDLMGVLETASEHVLHLRQLVQEAADMAGLSDSDSRTLHSPLKECHNDIGVMINRLGQFSTDLEFSIAKLNS